jgi:hypothetical protein
MLTIPAYRRPAFSWDDVESAVESLPLETHLESVSRTGVSCTGIHAAGILRDMIRKEIRRELMLTANLRGEVM